MQQEIEYLAPENFSMVEPGVYRSAFPRTKNIGFLKRLGLKAVLPLVPEDYPTAMADFYNQNGIKLISHGLDGNKWPFKQIDIIEFNKVLKDILDSKNRPILIHCNKGKHRTGSVIGCLRKLRGWSLSSIFHEYLSFSAPKSRLEDQIFIEAFNVEIFYNNLDLLNIIKLEEVKEVKEVKFENLIININNNDVVDINENNTHDVVDNNKDDNIHDDKVDNNKDDNIHDDKFDNNNNKVDNNKVDNNKVDNDKVDNNKVDNNKVDNDN